MDRCLSMCCYIAPINHIYIYKMKEGEASVYIQKKTNEERKKDWMTIVSYCRQSKYCNCLLNHFRF